MSSLRPREDMPPLNVAVTTRGTDLWVQVCGEVDVSNRHKLHTALSTVQVDDADVINLDLRQLSFCDTRGCRILLLFERKARLSGHQTRIHGATRTIRKVLRFISTGDRFTFT